MARTDTLGHFLTDVADAIRTKKGTSDTIQASDFDTEIVNLPSGGGSQSVSEKDVNFYDYDGTLVNSYSKTDFAELSEMPENPSHSGLTAQGWNWSLADAKTYVNKYGFLNIGQNYITDDGATRLYINLPEGRTSPYLSFGVNGSVEVDWGDGSNVETIIGTSTNTRIDTLHEYSQAGNYVISILPSGTTKIQFIGSGTNIFSRVLWGLGNTLSLNSNSAYIDAIEKVELGNGVNLVSGFAYCRRLKTITIPSDLTGFGVFSSCYMLKFIVCPIAITSLTGVFENCLSLKGVCLPKTITFLGQSTFNGCQSIKSMAIPEGVTFINTRMFSNNFSLEKIVIPTGITQIYNYAFSKTYGLQEIVFPQTSNLKLNTSPFEEMISATKFVFGGNVQSVGSSCFYQCYTARIIDFSNCTAIPTCTSGAFNNVPDDCQIIVPDDLYEDWIVATNWTTYADKIIKLSDYEAQ